MVWSEVQVADRDPIATYDDALPREIRMGGNAYRIPRYDIATVPPEDLKTVRLKSRNDVRINGTWAGSITIWEIPFHDSFRPSTGNDMAMVICDSRDGTWIQLWAFSAYLWEWRVAGRLVAQTGSAGSGFRWVGAANKLPGDYRRWNGNAKGMMGASLGPCARGATIAELATAIATPLGVLPRALPMYLPNPGGGVSPAVQAEIPTGGAGLVPSGAAWFYPSLEKERQAWADRRTFKTPAHKAAALVFARSLSGQGRGAINAASGPGVASVFTEDDLHLPADLLDGMPGLAHPTGLEPMVGYRRGVRVGTGPGQYDEIRLT